MLNEKLKKANTINTEIKSLEDFLRVAENQWQGKLTIEKQKYIFKTVPYGTFDEKSIVLDTEMKNNILSLFKNRLNDLKKQLEELLINFPNDNNKK